MLPTPSFVVTDPAFVARLVRENPWTTFVSPASTGLVASHYVALLDEDAWAARGELVLEAHFGRGDVRPHELGEHEILMVVAGPHDYVSPSLYPEGQDIPTWNHVTAHLYGTPELLDDTATYASLERLVHHFEDGRADPPPRIMGDERETARGTQGLRIRVTRFEARAKLSQNKDPETRARITERLRAANPPLAAWMERF